MTKGVVLYREDSRYEDPPWAPAAQSGTGLLKAL